MERYICIHGHFYQPPRENPWLEEIELQDSAYPYHDWNQRISSECYGPNANSRILGADSKIVDMVNNYSKISFNFGPTLLSWMKKHRPSIYEAIIEADKISRERFSGHGSALAQVFNHIIMPLANQRDKYTQVIWGIKDFEERFGRFPEGMWLAETAVDVATLEVLAELGIKFTILAPTQAKRVKKMGKGGKWTDVSGGKIDPTMAYLCVLPSGKHINLFFYDGPVSQDVAFGGLLNNGETFANRLLNISSENRSWPQLLHIATDGETYGHHHRYGDMALTYCLDFIEKNKLAGITNYAEYLEKHPPFYMVETEENTSWSCAHGVSRWGDDCGCSSGLHPDWNQKWRKPLREAMDWLRGELSDIYEKEASRYFNDPWQARNDYVQVLLNRFKGSIDSFLAANVKDKIFLNEKGRIVKLLEMQKNSLFMYTSCGWFFDDISGIESTQVMRYAARAIQLAEEYAANPLEAGYLEILKKAKSNIGKFGEASNIYRMFAKAASIDLLRVAVHYAISSIFEDYPEDTNIYCYRIKSKIYAEKSSRKFRLITGRVKVISEVTLDEKDVDFSVLHLGDHNITCGAKEAGSEKDFEKASFNISSAFDSGDITGVTRLMDDYFEKQIFSLIHLFKDEQRKVLEQILKLTIEDVNVSFKNIYENNYSIMNFLQSSGIPLPRPLFLASEYMINSDLKKAFEKDEVDIGKIKSLIDEASKWSVNIDKDTLGFVASSKIVDLLQELQSNPQDKDAMSVILDIVKLLRESAVPLRLWKVQNICLAIERDYFEKVQKEAEAGDDASKEWVRIFKELSEQLNFKV
ncbi:MAG: DUF3536 domain-containing protein [Candidatus Omnitrophica bacterium]|nr:DUF3536 domain-containing protein [Candidatus Omnitrophota bacterium]MBD3269369.1 DUF3536 domain-containing protein [Candidatus Omnitrophota bacterium]